MTKPSLTVGELAIVVNNAAKRFDAHHRGAPERGCFWSPQEWKARGEEYGRSASLIVTHDGGPYAGSFNPNYGDRRAYQGMADALGAVGYYAQQCTGWYTAIYPIGDLGPAATPTGVKALRRELLVLDPHGRVTVKVTGGVAALTLKDFRTPANTIGADVRAIVNLVNFGDVVEFSVWRGGPDHPAAVHMQTICAGLRASSLGRVDTASLQW